jgi:oligopeptidase B
MNPESTQETVVTAETTLHLQPPVAARKPTEHHLHGSLRIDDYAWLREKSNPEVIRHLEAENAYTDAVLKPTELFQEALYQEMLSRIQQTDLSVPYQLRAYLYFTKTIAGKQYPQHYRRKMNCGSEHPEGDELLLDLNALAEGHSFLGLGAFEVSDDNRLLAYSTDTTGFRRYTLQIKDLASGQLLPFRTERVTGAAWAGDNRTLFYTVEDDLTKRSHRLYRHTLGDANPDPLLFDETDERFRIEIERTRSGAYLLLISASHTTSEARFLSAAYPNREFQLFTPREDAHEYYPEHHPGFPIEGLPNSLADVFLIRTNSGGRTFRFVAAPVPHPQRSNWIELIPNRPAVMLSSVQPFRSHLVLLEREDGLPFLRIVPLNARSSSSRERQSPDWRLGAETPEDLLSHSYRIPFTEPAYNAAPGPNPEFDQSHFRYSYESFVTPRSVFDFDVATRQSTLRKQQPVLGGYDSSQYVSERIHAVASDGTRIPLSLVYKKTTPHDSSAPLLLYGYGSYGISIPVNFSSNQLARPRRHLRRSPHSRWRRTRQTLARCRPHAPQAQHLHRFHRVRRALHRHALHQ